MRLLFKANNLTMRKPRIYVSAMHESTRPRVAAAAPLTKGHHAAEAANVGVELLDALDQLVASIDVNARVLVAQAAAAAVCRCRHCPPALPPRRCMLPNHAGCWSGLHDCGAAAGALHSGRLVHKRRPHAMHMPLPPAQSPDGLLRETMLGSTKDELHVGGREKVGVASRGRWGL